MGSLEHVQSGKLSGIRETLSVWNMSNPGNSLGYGKHCRFGTCPIRETLRDTGNTVGLEHVKSGKLSGIRETLSVWNMSNPGNSLGYGKHCRFGTCPIREALWDTGNTVGLEHVQSGKLSGIRETLSVWNMSNPGSSLGYGKHCRNMSNVCSPPVSSLHNATRAACGANIDAITHVHEHAWCRGSAWCEGYNGGVLSAVRALCEKLAVLHHREFGKLKGCH